MDSRGPKEISEELECLMQEQIDCFQRQTFLGITEEELAEERHRLQRIREVSSQFLQALKKKIAILEESKP